MARTGDLHAVAILDLPSLHKDPFDRMLIAQAQVEGLTPVTSGQPVARHAGNVLQV